MKEKKIIQIMPTTDWYEPVYEASSNEIDSYEPVIGFALWSDGSLTTITTIGDDQPITYDSIIHKSKIPREI